MIAPKPCAGANCGAAWTESRQRSGPVAANRVRAALSALWTWGLRTGLIEAESNPVSFTVRNPEKPRERVLNDDELKAIWNATNEDADYARIVRLCLLTGCRREEIGGLRWDEVHADRIVFGPRPHEGKRRSRDRVAADDFRDVASPAWNAEGCVFGKRGTGLLRLQQEQAET